MTRPADRPASTGHWKAVVAVFKLVGLLAAGACLYNWFSLPPSLSLAQARQLNAAPVLLSLRRQPHVRVMLPGQRIDVPCHTVQRLCRELRQRSLPALQLWLFDTGLLGGEWILQAREGGRLWVSFEEQQRQFEAMRQRSALAAALAALGLGIAVLARSWRKAAKGRRHR